MDFETFRRERDGAVEFDCWRATRSRRLTLRCGCEMFPQATLPSEPNLNASADPKRPHRLHCGAWFPELGPERTSQELRSALGRFDVTRGNGDAQARVVFAG